MLPVHGPSLSHAGRPSPSRTRQVTRRTVTAVFSIRWSTREPLLWNFSSKELTGNSVRASPKGFGCFLATIWTGLLTGIRFKGRMNPARQLRPLLRLASEFCRARQIQVASERHAWRCRNCGISDCLRVYHIRSRSSLGDDHAENLLNCCSGPYCEVHQHSRCINWSKRREAQL